MGFDLPSSVSVGGADYPIRTDYRVVLDVFKALNDAELSAPAKAHVMGVIMFPTWDEIPPEHKAEAIERAVEFIDNGHKDDGKPHPRMIDWEQDSDMIAAAINTQIGGEVRSVPYMHWWTFLGHFMGIRESLLSSVLNIRAKKAKHKKLEKWEEEFYRDNRDIIDLKRAETAEEKAAREEMEKYL